MDLVLAPLIGGGRPTLPGTAAEHEAPLLAVVESTSGHVARGEVRLR